MSTEDETLGELREGEVDVTFRFRMRRAQLRQCGGMDFKAPKEQGITVGGVAANILSQHEAECGYIGWSIGLLNDPPSTVDAASLPHPHCPDRMAGGRQDRCGLFAFPPRCMESGGFLQCGQSSAPKRGIADPPHDPSPPARGGGVPGHEYQPNNYGNCDICGADGDAHRAVGGGVEAEPRPGEPFVTEYTIDALPESIDGGLWQIVVGYRGGGLWAVSQHSQCLGSDGSWDWEPSPSNRTDAWKAAHRFPLDQALALAREAFPSIVINGRTAAEGWAFHVEHGHIPPSEPPWLTAPTPAAAPLDEPGQATLRIGGSTFTVPTSPLVERIVLTGDLDFLDLSPAPAPVEDAQEPPATPEWVKALGDAVDRAKAETRLAQEPPVEERCAWSNKPSLWHRGGIGWCRPCQHAWPVDDDGVLVDHAPVTDEQAAPPTARPETEVERDG